MSEAQFLTYVLSGAGIVLPILMAIIGFLVVRGFDAFKESIAGVREDFREKCDEITDELRTISKRVTDNSEAVSGRITNMEVRFARIETKLERCKHCGNPD